MTFYTLYCHSPEGDNAAAMAEFALSVHLSFLITNYNILKNRTLGLLNQQFRIRHEKLCSDAEIEKLPQRTEFQKQLGSVILNVSSRTWEREGPVTTKSSVASYLIM